MIRIDVTIKDLKPWMMDAEVGKNVWLAFFTAKHVDIMVLQKNYFNTILLVLM